MLYPELETPCVIIDLDVAERNVRQMQALAEAPGPAGPGDQRGRHATAHLVKETPGVTEMRPGTYIFKDRNTMLLGLATESDCAMRVLTTVVSHPVPDRAVVDAGSKSLAADVTAAGGHGHVVG